MDNSNVITHSGKDLIKILDEEINDLHKYFSNLSPSLFTNPSSADGWTNADVLSHITMGALSYHMYLSRALEGILDPPEGLVRLRLVPAPPPERLGPPPHTSSSTQLIVFGGSLYVILMLAYLHSVLLLILQVTCL